MQEIPFYQHDLGEPELASLREVLAGPILTTGETVERFEQRFAEYLGAKHALGLNSCTGALHLALAALNIGHGDEVITTPMTFIATATAIIQAGATPVFVDVEPNTGNIDPNRIEAAITDRTRAIIPVHLYGLMCDMPAIRSIADKHHLHIIEDAAHCIEGSRDGIRPGELSDAACFSFYATKNLTCGEGGAVVTNDHTLANKIRLLRLHGMTSSAADREKKGYSHWDMVDFGWKYNMDNIQAALLLPQLDRVESNSQLRQALAETYDSLLKDIDSLRLPITPNNCLHARHLFPIWIKIGRRDEFLVGLKKAGIGVVVNYRAIHLLTYFRKRFGFNAGAFPVAERLGNEVISLPFYPSLCHDQIHRIVKTLSDLCADMNATRSYPLPAVTSQ